MKSDLVLGPPLLLLTLDPGSSLSKIIYRIEAGKSELIAMEPQVAEVTRETLDFYQATKLIQAEPEHEAWIESDGKYYAVGFLAKEQFGAKVDLNRLKYEGAIPKVLAAVGVIAAREGCPDAFDLALALPLPFSEWQDRERFKRAIARALSSFVFCGRTLSVQLHTCICVPEGGGHAMVRGHRVGSVFAQQKVASLMLGFRDISVVLIHRGVTTGQTQPYGLNRMVERVQSRTSGQSGERLLKAIHQAGTAIRARSFRHLARSENPEFQNEEVAQIVEAVQASRLEYWELVSRWLRSLLPADVDEVVVGGGTAAYLKADLRALLAQVTPQAHVSWAAELEEDVRVSFNLAPDQDALSLRLTDAYGLSRFLQSQVKPLPQPTPARVPSAS